MPYMLNQREFSSLKVRHHCKSGGGGGGEGNSEILEAKPKRCQDPVCGCDNFHYQFFLESISCIFLFYLIIP